MNSKPLHDLRTMNSKTLRELADLIDRSPLPVSIPRRRGVPGWLTVARGRWPIAAAALPVLALAAFLLGRRRHAADAEPDLAASPDADVTADSARQGTGEQRNGRVPTPVPGARHH
jgi:hypothetical protein